MAAPWRFGTGTKYTEATPANDNESLVWELASILFDRHHDEFSSDIPDEFRSQFQKRITKDRLSAFWSRLCREEATFAVAAAGNTEERAIAYLSMHKISEACNALIEGKNYRLATLVAQIGGDQVLHDDMESQISDWRRLNTLSEFSDQIRTLYELVAGNTCTSIGKTGHLEDRASTFVISERFNMGWKRAFGLKLWYAILTDDPLEKAVQEFILDLSDSKTKKPFPSFTGDTDNFTKWSDPHAAQREDVLWGLLKLYASRSDTTPSLSEVVSPENATGNPLSTRLSFELYHTLTTHFPAHSSHLGGDQLTLSFASELSSAGSWLWCLFVLLRLSDSQQRQKALQSTLASFAASIDENDPFILKTLFEDFQIPQAWIWEAKALHARAVTRDHVAETRFLLRAENFAEAHATLCSVVAPQAVVERDYSVLNSLLGGFKIKPTDWNHGGGVYADYLALVDSEETGKKSQKEVVGRLLRVLAEMKDKDGKVVELEGGFLRKVAMQEMSAVVGDRVLKGQDADVSRPAQLLW